MSKDGFKSYKIINNDEIDLKALWMVLWTNKLALIKITAGFFVVGVVYLFLAENMFYSNATITQAGAEETTSVSSILSIASSVGMDVGKSSKAATIDVVDFVESRRLQNDILGRTWENNQHDKIDLIEYWGINDTTGIMYSFRVGLKALLNSKVFTEEEIRIKWFARGRTMLSERVLARYTDTGLIIIEVWMEDPLLAQNLTSYIIKAIIDYTSDVKTESWRNNREFLVQRMQDVEVELKQAEDKMIQFEKDNQRISGSPGLLIQLENLKRAVEMKTQLYITLQTEYEHARLEEAKDLTGIVVLDDAFFPVEPDSPKRNKVLMISILLGLLLAPPGYLLFRSIRK